MAGINIHSQITDSAEIHVPKGFTEAANHTGMIKNAAGQLQWVDLDSLGENSNFTAVVDPTVSNDSSEGYAIGSRWCNTVQKNMFICVDASVGAAIWRVILKVNPAGTVPPTITDDASQGYKEGSVWIVRQSGLNQVWICADSTIGAAEWEELITGSVVGLDHRTLSHLDSDDHLQYLNRSGVRPMTGALDMGNQSIVNVLQVNGISIPANNVVNVKTNPGTAEFGSVAAAMASITTASPTSPVTILVHAGLYIEPQIVMKPYVSIIGTSAQSCILVANDPTTHFVIGADNSSIQQILLSGGVVASGGVLLHYSAASTSAAFLANNCFFTHSETLIHCEGNGSFETTFILSNCASGPDDLFTTGVKIDSVSSVKSRMIITGLFLDTTNSATPPTDHILLSGAGSILDLNGSLFLGNENAPSGNGIHCLDGSTLVVLSSEIKYMQKALWVENSGAGPSINIDGVQTSNNVNDIVINHPGTTGAMNVIAREEASTFDAGTIGNLSIVITDPDGDFLISETIRTRQPDNTFTDTTTLASSATSMGLLTVGDINLPVSGFTVTIEAGFGYIQKSDGSLRKIEWPDTPITIPSNSVRYIYFDETSTLQMSSSFPNTTQNILIGRVVTDGTGIIVTDESGLLAKHAGNNIGQALRQGLGAVYANGSNVSELGTRTLAVTPGSYFYGERNYLSLGGSPITFITFYQNGSGGFVNTLNQTVVDNVHWDNGTGTLAAIGAGNYVKHSLYAIGDSSGDNDSEGYFLVYSQAQYTALTLAEQGALPNPPNYLSEAVVLIASIIVQQGTTNIVEIRDERPISSSRRTSTVAAATFHSNLLGLTVGDDHPQYWRNDGTHVATGDFNLGTHDITNVGAINGVVVENHHARHQPGGADAIPTSAAFTLNPDQANAVGTSANLSRADHIHNVPTAAAVTLDSNSTNTQGTSTSFARADHTHAVTSGTPVTQNTDQANATGSAAGFAKSDHIHNIPTDVPVSLNSTNANTQGVSTKFSRADHVHNIVVAIASTQTPNQVNAAGVAAGISRADHIHNIPTGIASGLNANSANAQGSAAAFAQQDHIHAILSSAASTQVPNQANAVGTSSGFARADHIHNIPTAAPVTQNPDNANADGVAATFSRSDHVHNIPADTAISLNANSTSTEGVSTSFARADHTHAIASGTPSTQNADQANAVGSSTNFARADHIHNIPTAAPIDVGSANSQGSASTFAKSDHVHKGLHSIKSNAGAQRFGDVSLQNGIGISIVDDGAGNFTINTTAGDDELFVTSGGGLVVNYTAGNVLINGAYTAVAASSITVGANITNGWLYVDTTGTVASGATLPDGVVPFAQFTSGPSSVSSLSDRRAFLDVNATFGLVGDIQTLNATNAAAAGTANKNARADHVHAVTTGAASTQTPNQANATGTSASLARADHTHSIPTATASGLNANSANTQGAAASFAQSDHTHAIASGAASTQVPNQANAVGTSANFVRADHVHNIPTGTPSALTPNAGNSQGSAAAFAQQDHIHNVPTAAPANQTIAAAASDGSAATFSRSDHLHTFSTAAAVTQNTDQANAAGSSTSFARADHIHNIPTATAVSLNANSTSAQGSSTSFARADHTHAIASGAASTQTPNQANATGTSTNFARADHIHNIPTAVAATISSNTDTQGSASTFAQSDHTHQLTAASAVLDSVPSYDGANWQAVLPEQLVNSANAFVKYEEFFTATGELNWVSSLAGGGSTIAVNGAKIDANHPGVVKITAGGAGGNFANLNLTPIMLLGGGVVTYIALINIETLATVTNDYVIRVGLGDTATASDQSNGIYFEYNRSSSANWIFKSANGGTRTSTTSSTAVATGWTKLVITTDAAASTITYTVNGVSLGTITTNIPTTNNIGMFLQQARSAGTPVGFDVDFIKLYQRFTTSR